MYINNNTQLLREQYDTQEFASWVITQHLKATCCIQIMTLIMGSEGYSDTLFNFTLQMCPVLTHFLIALVMQEHCALTYC
jgi:hypothetical protein